MLKFFKVHIYQSHLQDHRLLLLHHLHRLGHLPPPRHPLPPLPKFRKKSRQIIEFTYCYALF